MRSYHITLFTSSLYRNLQDPTTLDLPNEGYSQSYSIETKKMLIQRVTGKITR